MGPIPLPPPAVAVVGETVTEDKEDIEAGVVIVGDAEDDEDDAHVEEGEVEVGNPGRVLVILSRWLDRLLG